MSSPQNIRVRRHRRINSGEFAKTFGYGDHAAAARQQAHYNAKDIFKLSARVRAMETHDITTDFDELAARVAALQEKVAAMEAAHNRLKVQNGILQTKVTLLEMKVPNLLPDKP
jgi:uncharacterized HAD superfamily protein